MSDFLIETENLTFAYGSQPILHGISLRVKPGAVYGFIGQNGAGKTTTIKVLLSLLPEFGGQVRLFGQSIRRHRLDILARTGALVEEPALYQHLTGQENLLNRALLLRLPGQRALDILRQVGLYEARYKKVAAYSQGMRQRLGIGLALLGAPDLLILDEPTNGLDPNGIREIRELLTGLSRQGVTVFLSSHLLSEVEKIVTDLGIIHQGRLLFQGPIESLRDSAREELRLDTSDNRRCFDLLQADYPQVGWKNGLPNLGGVSREEAARLNARLVGQGLAVYALEWARKDLEQLYFDIIQTPPPTP